MMKKVCRFLTGMVFALILAAFIVPVGEVRASEGTITFSYAYDCQRSPSYPRPGKKFELWGLDSPQDLERNELLNPEELDDPRSWKLVPVSAEADLEQMMDEIDSMVRVYSAHWGVDVAASDFPVYKLYMGERAVGYVAIVYVWENNQKCFAILENGCGYFLTNSVPAGRNVDVSIPAVRISSVAITDIEVPVTGARLDTSAVCTAAGEMAAGVIINNATVAYTPNDEKAQANVSYAVSVTLPKAETYEFAGTVLATVNGNAATVGNNGDGSITVSYEFPATGSDNSNDSDDSNDSGDSNNSGDSQTSSGVVILGEEETKKESQEESQSEESTPAKTFEQELEELILAAKAEKLRTGKLQTIKVISYYKDGITLTNKIMKLLIGSDVTLDLEYRYDGKQYRSIIAAGTAQNNEIPFYGPLYLYRDYGVYCGEIIW